MVKLNISTLALWDIREKYFGKGSPEESHNAIIKKIREAEKRALKSYGKGKITGIELGLLPKLFGHLRINDENLEWLNSLPYNTIHGVYDKDRTNLEVEKEWYKRLNAKNITYHPDSTPQDFLKKLLDEFETASIENMDNRKQVGRTIASLEGFFEKYPGLAMTLDMNHSMIPAFTSDLIEYFKDKIVEVHCSGVNFSNLYRHIPLVDTSCHPLSLETLDLVRDKLPEAIYVIESELVKRKRRHLPKEMSLVDN